MGCWQVREKRKERERMGKKEVRETQERVRDEREEGENRDEWEASEKEL